MTDDDFARLVEEHRGELRAHCYRMLGSVHDAEDALQETLLRAWRGIDTFEGRSSLRSWLYSVATNVCLRALERRPKRVLPIDYGPGTADPHSDIAQPLTESVWIEPYPTPDISYEQRESVELAFIAAPQHLPPQQRAVLILRDVLGFSGAETAEALDTNADAVYSALQRAHRTVRDRLPEQTQQVTLRALGDERLRTLVTSYVDAWERHDVDAIAAMLAHDAALTMPPVPTWFRGRDTIAAFLRSKPFASPNRWRVVPAQANGQPAFGHYRWADEAQAFAASELVVLTLAGDEIAELTIFRDAGLLAQFAMPDHL